MRRTFWFGAGAASAVYLSRKVRLATERMTPAGLADRMLAWGTGLRVFVDDVRTGTAEREAELWQALELGDHPRRPPVLVRGTRARGDADVA